MSEELIQYNIAYISALAAIIGAIIGALASLLSSWFSRKVIEAGKVEVFCKFVSSKAMHNEFGFYHSGTTSGLFLDVPMWIEIANTSMTAKFIRDLNIVAFNGNKKVAEFSQLQGSNIGTKDELEYGNHQSYSFMVPEKAIEHYYVEFILQEATLQNNNKEFNIIKARYYDENGKKHEKVVYSSKQPIEWNYGTLKHKKEWISLNGRKN